MTVRASPSVAESPTAGSRNQPPPPFTAKPPPAVAAQRPTPGILAALTDPVLGPRVLKAAFVALAKNLGHSALVMIPGLILLAISPILGVIWMFCGSFLLMARTYATPWRLMWITCLMPAIAAGVCFLIQLAVFSDRIPPTWLLIPSASAGLGIGVLRARSHALYLENGAVMAQRTSGYLVIWAICYGVTQLLGLFGDTMPLIKGSLLASALSTSMLVCVSLVILSRYHQLRHMTHVEKSINQGPGGGVG
ncbi:MAG: hypothetical protein KDB01_08240 [Planctomycetaceae bacterium]|nr:hypothetical protein [Planctomycetaceae bacterium]